MLLSWKIVFLPLKAEGQTQMYSSTPSTQMPEERMCRHGCKVWTKLGGRVLRHSLRKFDNKNRFSVSSHVQPHLHFCRERRCTRGCWTGTRSPRIQARTRSRSGSVGRRTWRGSCRGTTRIRPRPSRTYCPAGRNEG